MVRVELSNKGGLVNGVVATRNYIQLTVAALDWPRGVTHLSVIIEQLDAKHGGGDERRHFSISSVRKPKETYKKGVGEALDRFWRDHSSRTGGKLPPPFWINEVQPRGATTALCCCHAHMHACTCACARA